MSGADTTPPGYVAPRAAGNVAIGFLVLRACVDLPLILVVPLAPALVQLVGGTAALDLVHALTWATFAMLAVTAIAYLVWFHRVVANARVFAEEEVPYTPGEAVASWFIPILSLFRPYQIMRVVERTSLRMSAAPSSLVASWWAAYYGRLLFRMAVALATPSLDEGARIAGAIAAISVELVAVGLAIAVIRYVVGLQEARAAMSPDTIAEVFR